MECANLEAVIELTASIYRGIMDPLDDLKAREFIAVDGSSLSFHCEQLSCYLAVSIFDLSLIVAI